MRIYQEFSNKNTIFLDERNKHHLVNVMRCRVGDECQVFDGQGLEVRAKIISMTKKEVILEILDTIKNNNESPLNIHLFQALCKGEKMDWIMQKSVELGVTEITPILTERSDVKISSNRLEKKIEHWKNIIVSASEQSNRAILPKIHATISLQQALSNTIHTMTLLFSPSAQSALRALQYNSEKISIFIGPEGGFSETEILMAEKQGAYCVTLGKRVLRTETAPLAAIAGLQTLWGDFK